jgi:hypothetical protein
MEDERVSRGDWETSNQGAGADPLLTAGPARECGFKSYHPHQTLTVRIP